MKLATPVLAATAVLLLAGCAEGSAPAADASNNPTTEATTGATSDWAHPGAPDIFKFRTADLVTGEQVDGTDLLYKDVVLWFWAPWCPVCDAEAPALLKAMENFPDGVTVLGVAGRGDVATSEQFIADHPGIESFPHIYDDDGTIWKDFDVTGQPTMVLINQDGQSQTFSGAYSPDGIAEKVAWLGEN